jgi:hypothetical protein
VFLATPNFESDDSELTELAMLYFMQSNEEKKLSRYRKSFYQILSSFEKKRRSRKIPRDCLHHPNSSVWRMVLGGSSDAAMITLTGLNHASFALLYTKFQPSPHNSNGTISRIRKPGRRRVFASSDCLGLCLAWTRTRGALFVLSMIFGITGSGTSQYLRFSRRLLIEILRKERTTKVKIPNDDEI